MRLRFTVTKVEHREGGGALVLMHATDPPSEMELLVIDPPEGLTFEDGAEVEVEIRAGGDPPEPE